MQAFWNNTQIHKELEKQQQKTLLYKDCATVWDKPHFQSHKEEEEYNQTVINENIDTVCWMPGVNILPHTPDIPQTATV